MKKKKQQQQKQGNSIVQLSKKSFCQKLKDFFFPKNFWQDLRQGTQIGKIARDKAFEKAFNSGKFLRKKIDPEHKMKV